MAVATSFLTLSFLHACESERRDVPVLQRKIVLAISLEDTIISGASSHSGLILGNLTIPTQLRMPVELTLGNHVTLTKGILYVGRFYVQVELCVKAV